MEWSEVIKNIISHVKSFDLVVSNIWDVNVNMSMSE